MPGGFWLRTMARNHSARRFCERRGLRHKGDAPHPRHPEVMFSTYEWERDETPNPILSFPARALKRTDQVRGSARASARAKSHSARGRALNWVPFPSLRSAGNDKVRLKAFSLAWGKHESQHTHRHLR